AQRDRPQPARTGHRVGHDQRSPQERGAHRREHRREAHPTVSRHARRAVSARHQTHTHRSGGRRPRPRNRQKHHPSTRRNPHPHPPGRRRTSRHRATTRRATAHWQMTIRGIAGRPPKPRTGANRTPTRFSNAQRFIVAISRSRQRRTRSPIFGADVVSSGSSPSESSAKGAQVAALHFWFPISPHAQVWNRFWNNQTLARTTVGAALASGSLVEIEADARRG